MIILFNHKMHKTEYTQAYEDMLNRQVMITDGKDIGEYAYVIKRVNKNDTYRVQTFNGHRAIYHASQMEIVK